MSSNKLPTTLDYDNGETHGLSKEAIRINASGINDYFTNTKQWYAEKLEGKEQGFQGNSFSVTGTITHFIAEQFVRFKTISKEDQQEISNYIKKHTDSNYSDYNADIDINYIMDNYRPMAETLINDYVMENMPSRVEDFVHMELADNLYVGGSIDAVLGGNITDCSNGKITVGSNPQPACIVDYKTTSMRPNSLRNKKINRKYKLQLLTYAWILTQQGQPVDRVRIVYVTQNDINRISEKTGKPMQSYPSEVVILTEGVTDEDLEMIESIIYMIRDGVIAWKDYPELRHVISQSYVDNTQNS